MASITISSTVAIICLSFLVNFLLRWTRKSIRIRGPPNPSFLLGHEWMRRHQNNHGDLEMDWFRKYGAVYRTSGCFAQDILMVSDPKALHHMFHSSDYRFIKTRDTIFVLDLLLGQGILSVQGEKHQHQRKVLSIAFSSAQLHQSLPMLQSCGARLVERLKDISDDHTGAINVLEWTRKVALDIVGTASFRYHFGMLDGEHSELGAAVTNLLGDAQINPSTKELYIRSLWRYLPDRVLKIMKDRMASRESTRFTLFGRTAKVVAKQIFQERLPVVAGQADLSEKDIVSLLAKSHLSDDEKDKMTDDEILSQLATFIFAGHETTASTLAWFLYELSSHPEHQARIREEIEACQGQISSLANYDSMSFLNAAIKEVLRLHPTIHSLVRMPSRDEVLPLAEPIRTQDGRTLNEVPVSKGQTVIASLYVYNRMPSIWGKDAGQWNPERFLDNDKKQGPLGVYANLMTFSTGARSCLGWRFAVMEIQVVIVELLRIFEFSLPKDGSVMREYPGSQMVIPLVSGKTNEGAQVPLHVKVVERSTQ
ncbi:cytochrome P450 [Desarmillaria tabescens]|uniref:Cytochrome P450 n=1 Tax=Armillaria tabescens TaxID=1929756 RepID=A0AA39N7P5_ARMTA|nr:cytochrome P450 [Desarmillaria tabescens]KAK0460548.1 cytochrome P450 [Desarmillaria tabescens]